MDKHLSQSDPVGLMIAVRLIPFGGWCMTTGGGIPVVEEAFDIITPILAKFDKRVIMTVLGITFFRAGKPILQHRLIGHCYEPMRCNRCVMKNEPLRSIYQNFIPHDFVHGEQGDQP